MIGSFSNSKRESNCTVMLILWKQSYKTVRKLTCYYFCIKYALCACVRMALHLHTSLMPDVLHGECSGERRTALAMVPRFSHEDGHRRRRGRPPYQLQREDRWLLTEWRWAALAVSLLAVSTLSRRGAACAAPGRAGAGGTRTLGLTSQTRARRRSGSSLFLPLKAFLRGTSLSPIFGPVSAPVSWEGPCYKRSQKRSWAIRTPPPRRQRRLLCLLPHRLALFRGTRLGQVLFCSSLWCGVC